VVKTAAVTEIRADPDPPSLSYFALMAGWTAGMVGIAWVGERRFEPFTAGEAFGYALATHGLARIVSMETVTLPLRTPFVDREFRPDGECIETPRGTGIRKAIGELVTCPYCCSTWAAAVLMTGRLVRPGMTRVLVGVLAAAAGANLLHRAFTALERPR
jgi:hypothetical protein